MDRNALGVNDKYAVDGVAVDRNQCSLCEARQITSRPSRGGVVRNNGINSAIDWIFVSPLSRGVDRNYVRNDKGILPFESPLSQGVDRDHERGLGMAAAPGRPSRGGVDRNSRWTMTP
ncbi:hypothetical protein CK223_29875 [Mesorhizobium loti]|nr:hypothetical protein CK223_29875 [Mesorhizobium loti]